VASTSSRNRLSTPAPLTETDTSADVEVVSAYKAYGDVQAVDGVDLLVRAGEFFTLLGPSGSGKTTLMRAVVGVQKVAGGTVSVLGRPAGTAELRERVAYVTQAPSVYADLTVRENLEYFARILDVPAERIGATLGTVGLGAYAQRVVGSLSGGERSRCSLAVALLHEPELLVLDEPTVGLDPLLRRELWQTFHELAGGGRTLLVSTHVMDEAERCDELVLMREGGVIADGTPAALQEEAHADSVEQAFIALAERAA
jgi:ABC-2 type transport system ATP-binding protein